MTVRVVQHWVISILERSCLVYIYAIANNTVHCFAQLRLLFGVSLAPGLVFASYQVKAPVTDAQRARVTEAST